MRRLRTQLSLFILLTLLVTIGLIGVFSNWFINWEFEKYITKTEQRRSENIVTDLGKQYDGFKRDWQLGYVHMIGMYSLYDGYILKVYDADGNTIWDAWNHDMALCGQIMEEISARMEKMGTVGGFVEHTYDIDQNGKKIGSVSVKYYGPYFLSDEDFTFIKALNTVLLIIGILSSVFSVLVGCLLARRISRPVTKTAYIAKQISEGNYDIRFERGTKIRELNDLVTAINHLASALSEQEKLRKRLTTDVAHELRTPLTAVSSHLEAMIDGLWEVTPERLQSCYDEIGRLGTLVADLERLAKIEGENLKLNKSRLDLLDIVHTVSNNMNAEINKKNLSFAIEGNSSFVQADKDRMNQVVTNLLSNAVKYTPEGGSIQIEVTGTNKTGIIKVRDNGIGIPESEHSLIFERFYRTDKSRNRKTGGAGIGLTIVKSIVAAHGGTVSVESNAEQGSCFTVSIPKGEEE
ncbi:sensor histidine kinase [Anaerocolumna xylanovorans]|uniref:histidine kinase n=1 Tax=Anaerocolumna xylanovorans DSM 12503 TaxID=1121345 RepID=A0A1M7YFH1_9FIRM|nr:HAMP domain-containing sensor histidine kinase [Anaerocolumna xylanovorans]SHO51370.1 Signal transduction histidine kinase [Anaerocolumna xylanovorans DSM 12503]